MNKREFIEGVVFFVIKDKYSRLQSKIIVELCVLYNKDNEYIKLETLTRSMLALNLSVSSFSFSNALFKVEKSGLIKREKKEGNYTYYRVEDSKLKEMLDSERIEEWVKR